MIKEKLLRVLAVVLFFAITSFKPVQSNKDAKNFLVIQIEHYVGNDVLKLVSSGYRNELGQEYTISKFKYFISGIHLKNKNGREFVSSEYFLVNEDEPTSKRIMLKDIPVGEYVSMSFTLGVDSAHNCSGAQSGALDPVNGMFWAWNTGYVFLKLDGKSSFSKSPGNIFEFHIGGYKGKNNCIRKISLDTGKQSIVITPQKGTMMRIRTDIAQIFKSPVTIDFAKLSSVTDFHNATMVADNYSDMFSLIDVQ